MKFYRTFWSLDTQILSSLYIAIHKFGVAMIFKMFLSLMLTKSAFIDQKCSNKKNIILKYYNFDNCFLLEYILKCNLFLWCKAEFSASLLQSSVSPRKCFLCIIAEYKINNLLT